MSHLREFTLAQLADAAGMSERNVRAYQARGLLPPWQRQGRRSLYGGEHITRLRLIRALHQHGLTLRVIADLVERDTADAELARLSREALTSTWTTGAQVPLNGEIVTWFNREHPGQLQALIDAGLVSREGEKLVGSATMLGMVSALYARGAMVPDSAAVSLCAARAASGCADELRFILDAVEHDADAGDAQIADLVVQLAASAFADVLGRALADPADPPVPVSRPAP